MTSKNERTVRLPHFMLDHPACMTLSPAAFKLLVYVWRRHNGRNNGEISFAVREGAAIGLSRSQTARAFDELVERGFLVKTRDSGFNVKGRIARVWRITAEPSGNKQEHERTVDFSRWSAPSTADSTVPPAGRYSPTSGTRCRKMPPQSHQRDCDSPTTETHLDSYDFSLPQQPSSFTRWRPE